MDPPIPNDEPMKDTSSTATTVPSSTPASSSSSSTSVPPAPQPSSSPSSTSSVPSSSTATTTTTNIVTTAASTPSSSSAKPVAAPTNPKPASSTFSSLTSGISLRGVGAAVLSFASVPQAATPTNIGSSSSAATTIGSPNSSQPRSMVPPTSAVNGSTTVNGPRPTIPTNRTVPSSSSSSSTPSGKTSSSTSSSLPSTATPTKSTPSSSSATLSSTSVPSSIPSSSGTNPNTNSSSSSSVSTTLPSTVTSPPPSSVASSLTSGAFGRLTSLVSVPSLSMSSFSTPPATNPVTSSAPSANVNGIPRTPNATPSRPLPPSITVLPSHSTTSRPNTTLSSSSSSSSNAALPIALLARLADLDLIQTNSGILQATCAGNDLTSLVNEGLCRMVWFRVHTLRDTVTQQPTGFRWEPLPNLRSNIYYPSIDDAGCRLLCKARATSTGRAILRQQGYTSVVGNSYGMAECPSVTLDANIGNTAHASFESGGAYFAVECASMHIRVTNKDTETVEYDTLTADANTQNTLPFSVDRLLPKSNVDITVDTMTMQLAGNTKTNATDTLPSSLQYVIPLPSSSLFIRIDPAVTNQINLVWLDTKPHDNNHYRIQYTLRLTTHTSDERNTIAATLRLFNHSAGIGPILTDPYITTRWLEAPEGDGDTSDEDGTDKAKATANTTSSPSVGNDKENTTGIDEMNGTKKGETANQDTEVVETPVETNTGAQPVILSLSDFLTAPTSAALLEDTVGETESDAVLKDTENLANDSEDERVNETDILKTDFATVVPRTDNSTDGNIDELPSEGRVTVDEGVTPSDEGSIAADAAIPAAKPDSNQEGAKNPSESAESLETVPSIIVPLPADPATVTVESSTVEEVHRTKNENTEDGENITTTATETNESSVSNEETVTADAESNVQPNVVTEEPEIEKGITSVDESTIATEIEHVPINKSQTFSASASSESTEIANMEKPTITAEADNVAEEGSETVETVALETSTETLPEPSLLSSETNLLGITPSETVPSNDTLLSSDIYDGVASSTATTETKDTVIATVEEANESATEVSKPPLVTSDPLEDFMYSPPKSSSSSSPVTVPTAAEFLTASSLPATKESVPDTTSVEAPETEPESIPATMASTETLPEPSFVPNESETLTTEETVPVPVHVDEGIIPSAALSSFTDAVAESNTDLTTTVSDATPSATETETTGTTDDSVTPAITVPSSASPVPIQNPSESSSLHPPQPLFPDVDPTVPTHPSESVTFSDADTLPVQSSTAAVPSPSVSSSSPVPPVSLVGYVKEEELRTLTHQLTEARKTIELQRTTVTRLQKEASDKENRVHSLEQTIATLTKERNEKDKAIEKALEDKRKGITAAVDEAKRTIATAKEEQRKQLTTALDETKKIQEEMKKLQEDQKKTVNQLQDEKKRLLEEAKRMMVTDHDNHKKALAAAQEETKKVQDDHKKFLNQVQEDNKKALNQLHEEIRRVNERNATLTNDLAIANKKIATVTEDGEQTKTELKKLQSTAKSLQSLQSQLTATKSEHEEVQKQLSTERTTIATQKEEIQRLQSEVSSLTASLQEIRTQFETASFETNRCREEVRELHAQLSAATVASAASEAAATRAQDTASATQAEVVALRAERDDLRSTLTATLQRYETLKKEEQERIQREAVEKATTSRSQAHINEVESLKERVAQLSRALEGTAADRAEAVHTAEQAETKFQQANQRIQTLEAEVRRLANSQEVVKAAERSCAEMKEMVDKAIMERNSAMKKFESIRQEMARVMGGESGESLKRINIEELKRAKEGLDGKVVKLIEENAQLREELEQFKNNGGSSSGNGSTRKPLNLLSSSSHEPSTPGSGGTMASPGSMTPQSTPVRPREGMTSNSSTKLSSSSSFFSPPPPTNAYRSGHPNSGTVANNGITSPSGSGTNTTSHPNTIMVNTLQNIIATLTAEMQDKEIAIEQQRQAKEQLGATIIQQLTMIQQLEEKVRMYEDPQRTKAVSAASTTTKEQDGTNEETENDENA